MDAVLSLLGDENALLLTLGAIYIYRRATYQVYIYSGARIYGIILAESRTNSCWFQTIYFCVIINSIIRVSSYLAPHRQAVGLLSLLFFWVSCLAWLCRTDKQIPVRDFCITVSLPRWLYLPGVSSKNLLLWFFLRLVQVYIRYYLVHVMRV